MRCVFMGTPDFAAVILRELAARHEVVAAYTRPDAIRGRGSKLVPSPVKEAALELGVPVIERTGFKDAESLEELRALQPDVIVVAAYSALLPQAVLETPALGCLNVHASLLPRWRGAAPVERAILAGDEHAGVCVMRMVEALDAGDYCEKRCVPAEGKTASELTEELAHLGAEALICALERLAAGGIEWTPQDEGLVCYAEKITKGCLDLDPGMTARENTLRVLASSPGHPSRAQFAGRACTVMAVREADASELPEQEMTAGALKLERKRLLAACGEGVLEVCELKPDGKKTMPGAAFAAGIQGIKNNGNTWGNTHE